MILGDEVRDGDCYKVAGDMLVNNQATGVRDTLLVHADIVSGERLGHRIIGHAWCEIGDGVFDFSNGRQVVTRKEKYYAVTKPRRVRKYTYFMALERMLETQHYGPWIKKRDGKYMTAEEIAEHYEKLAGHSSS